MFHLAVLLHKIATGTTPSAKEVGPPTALKSILVPNVPTTTVRQDDTPAAPARKTGQSETLDTLCVYG
jgi:hypothetical protein